MYSNRCSLTTKQSIDKIDLHPAYQDLRHSRKKIKPTRRLAENQVMSARQQIAAATSGNSNSKRVINRPMTRQLARQLTDNGRQYTPNIEPRTAWQCLMMCTCAKCHVKACNQINPPQRTFCFQFHYPGYGYSRSLIIVIAIFNSIVTSPRQF